MTMTQALLFDAARNRQNSKVNKLSSEDRPFHDWYRFVLAYPPHLVRDYIEDFKLTKNSVVLDPFSGTGTTLVECKLQGISSYGTEANSFAHFASSVKTNWNVNPDLLCNVSQEIAEAAYKKLQTQGINDNQNLSSEIDDLPLAQLTTEANELILNGSISPLPLHKILVLLDCLKQHKVARVYNHQLLALANALVNNVSNLHFGPEVGVGKPKNDAPVIALWLSEIRKIAKDLAKVRDKDFVESYPFLADARRVDETIRPGSVNAVITSPPYPNEKDYTRITRLESVVLGFINTKSDLQKLKKSLMRSNTRNVYKGDDDDSWATDFPEIQRIAETIEQRRLELGKTSGFEKLYGKVTKLYFGGMARHLSALRSVLHPNAQLAYVVGDQASYLRVMIRTGELLAEIAEKLGYELVRIDLFRTRLATATKEQLREEVVVLRWRG